MSLLNDHVITPKNIESSNRRENSLTTNNNPTQPLTYIPAIILLLLPPILGFAYMSFGIIYAGGLRSVVYDLSWLSFAFIFVAISNLSKVSLVDVGKNLPCVYIIVFLIFAVVWIYTTTIVAISPKMAYYTSGRGLAVILVGLAAAALKQIHGNKFTTSMGWALFGGAILHAPFLIWVYALEGQNPDFKWLWSLPGYPGLRLYNHAVEAAIAAGVGLYFIRDRQNTRHQTLLIIGTVLLWTLLFWGGARGAFFALLTTFILIAAIVPHFLSGLWKFFLSTMVLGASLSLLLPVPQPAYGILGRLNKSLASDSLDAATSGRLTIWSESIDLFLERPLFGHGLVQYQRLVEKLAPNTPEHVHNILFEALLSFGLIGTLALIYLLGKILLTSARHLRTRQSDSDIPMFYVATTLLAHGFVSGTYFHMHSMIAIAISLGLLLHSLGKSSIATN